MTKKFSRLLVPETSGLVASPRSMSA